MLESKFIRCFADQIFNITKPFWRKHALAVDEYIIIFNVIELSGYHYMSNPAWAVYSSHDAVCLFFVDCKLKCRYCLCSKDILLNTFTTDSSNRGVKSKPMWICKYLAGSRSSNWIKIFTRFVQMGKKFLDVCYWNIYEYLRAYLRAWFCIWLFKKSEYFKIISINNFNLHRKELFCISFVAIKKRKNTCGPFFREEFWGVYKEWRNKNER